MSKMIWAVLCTGALTLTSLGTVIEASKEASITCSAGTFPLGSPASVTCHFHIDVRAEKQSFYVEHIPANSVGFLDLDYAANCNIDDKGTHCLPRHVVKGRVTDQVVLDLGNASMDSGGLYRCRLVNLPDESSRWCMLTVLTGLPEDLNSPTLKQSQSTEPDTPHCENGKGCQTHMGAILVLVVILLVLMSTGIITVIYIRRYYKLVKRNASPSNQVENPQHLSCLPCLRNANGKPASKGDDKGTYSVIGSKQDNASQPVSIEIERVNDDGLYLNDPPALPVPYKPDKTEPRFERGPQQSPRIAPERSQMLPDPRNELPERGAYEEEGKGEEEVYKDAPRTDKPLSKKEKKELEDKRKKKEAQQKKEAEQKKKEEEKARKAEEKARETEKKEAEKKRKEEAKQHKKSGGSGINTPV